MDASKQAKRQGSEKGQKKQGRDDVKQGGDKGRFEGGRDSDQDRQAQGRQRDEDKPATSEPQSGGKGRRGLEEEE